jgi:hypothetical protein
MKSILKTTGIFMMAAAFMALSGAAGFAQVAAQEAPIAADLIVLTPNHNRTIAFSLDSGVGGANGIHAIFLQTTGGGNLQISIANTTMMKSGTELIYFVAGFINTTPVFDYVYSSGGTFSITVSNLPSISGGILFTGVLYKTSGIDYPVTMAVYAKLLPAASAPTSTTTTTTATATAST